MATAATDLLGMSDEEFLKLGEPGVDPAAADGAASPGSADQANAGGEVAPTIPPESQASGEAGTVTEGGAATPNGAGEGGAEAGGENVIHPPAKEGEAAVDPKDPAAPQGEDGKAPEGADKPAEAKTDTLFKAPSNEDAQAFYAQIMTPFKANGKTIELKDPKEAVALMQMGANYTRKMQELQPHRKTLLMLQNNDLLDPAKLSFLIDLDRGDPEAVKKFIKDRGIDPMDIDTSSDPAYSGGNHQVTDQEVGFRTVLEDLRSTPEGLATLQEVDGRWDNASKELLWQHPEILPVIQEARESGAYAKIVAEMDRQITLGTLKPNVPFLEAYRTVGDQLLAQHKAANPGADNANANPNPAAPQVVDTRVATPKSTVANADQVAAASPTKGKPAAQGNVVNFLEMPDDEFLKQFGNRV